MDLRGDRVLVCIRHGQTDYNIGKGGIDAEIYRGNLDIPINAQGEKEIREAAGKIGLPVRFIVSDSFPRDYQTANILSMETGAPVVIDERMQPINIGLLSGKSTKEVADVVDWFFKNPDAQFPGGETVRNWYERQESAILDYLDEDDGDMTSAIVIVCQGSTFRALPAMEHDDDWRLIESTMERVPTGDIEWIT